MARHAAKTHRRITGALTAVACAAGIAIAVPSAASADRADLRQGCEWVAEYAQKCQVHSDAMGRDIPVVVRPALSGNKVIQFLDGITIYGDTSGWIRDGKALDHLADTDATLVFPTGDSSSFYTDWDGDTADGRVMKYKTFLTEELPNYLEKNFQIKDGGVGHTGVAGLSMGAFGALSLASQRPDMYSSVLALSGFYNPADPAQSVVTDLVPSMDEKTGAKPWTTSQGRAVANPTVNLDNLTMPVTVTAASGITNLTGDLGPDAVATIVNGGPLESGSLMFTGQFQALAMLHGRNNIRFIYDPIGAHAWDTWNRAAWDRGLMAEMIDNA